MSESASDGFPSHTFAVGMDLPSLDSGWRTFPGRYLLYASRGAFHLEIQDAQWYLPPQRAAWVAPHERIRIWADRPVTSSSILFSPGSPAPANACLVFAVTPLAREMILYSMKWTRDRDPNDAAADQFFGAVANVCAELAAQPERFWLPKAPSAFLTTVTTYVQEHLGQPLSVAHLARVVHVSERTLARRFADELGMSCAQFVNRARMLAALDQLAAPERSVSEIAWAVGFESLSAFTAAFKTFAQQTPSQYRRRLLG